MCDAHEAEEVNELFVKLWSHLVNLLGYRLIIAWVLRSKLCLAKLCGGYVKRMKTKHVKILLISKSLSSSNPCLVRRRVIWRVQVFHKQYNTFEVRLINLQSGIRWNRLPTGKRIVVRKRNLNDACLNRIGQHQPVSIELIHCRGDGSSPDGVRDLFRQCTDSLQVRLK